MCTADNGTNPAFNCIDGLTDDSNVETIMFLVHFQSGKSKVKSYLAESLSLMFTSFMSISKVPEEWKHALVTSVYNRGLASNVANYRLISLKCVVCKLIQV